VSGATHDRMAALRRMLEHEPDDAFCLYGIAQEHMKRGEPREAVAYFDRAAAADPDHAYAHFHKAKALDGLGDRDGAMAALRAGLAVARRTGDAKAQSEIAAMVDSLGG
jgi:Flp pilus assembly protein TadD